MDIREGSSGSHLATLDAAGIVRLWSVQPLELLMGTDRAPPRHPPGMFTPNPRHHNPLKNPMTCLYTMNPWVLNVPKFTDKVSAVNMRPAPEARRKALDI